MNILVVLLMCLLFLNESFSENGSKRRLKILINNPAIGWSHVQLQGRLADVLIEAGHEVHMLVQMINPLNGNYTGSKRVQEVIRVDRPIQKRNDFLEVDFFDNPFTGINNMLIDGTLDLINEIFTDCCKEFLESQQLLIEELTKERYDVGISEFMHICTFGIFHKIGIQTKLATNAFMVSAMTAGVFGVPSPPSYVVNFHAASINGQRMSFWKRVRNMYYNNMYDVVHSRHSVIVDVQQLFNKEYGPDFPHLFGIMKNISLGFFNGNEFLELPRPISNKIIYIGGIVKSEPRPVDPEFKPIIDRAKKGVVLFSFGSMADTKVLNPQTKRAFFNSFAKFPDYEFIWKLTENDTGLAESAPNVHIFEWFDQRGILAHPKTKVFLTHCGMNSLNEAIGFGVPLIAIPLFADQLFNTAAVLDKGIGVYLDILEAKNEDAVIKALNEVLENSMYYENSKTLQKKVHSAPFKPEEKFVKWVEFAAEFSDLNELNLLSPIEMGILAYYSLDVIGVTVLLSVLILTLFGFIVTFVKRKLLFYVSEVFKPKIE